MHTENSLSLGHLPSLVLHRRGVDLLGGSRHAADPLVQSFDRDSVAALAGHAGAIPVQQYANKTLYFSV